MTDGKGLMPMATTALSSRIFTEIVARTPEWLAAIVHVFEGYNAMGLHDQSLWFSFD